MLKVYAVVSRSILFKKVAMISKCKLPKIKSNFSNIPVNEVYDDCEWLPIPADSNGLLMVNLKLKS